MKRVLNSVEGIRKSASPLDKMPPETDRANENIGAKELTPRNNGVNFSVCFLSSEEEYFLRELVNLICPYRVVFCLKCSRSKFKNILRNQFMLWRYLVRIVNQAKKFIKTISNGDCTSVPNLQLRALFLRVYVGFLAR
jgi:hypothetical protein